MAEREAPSPGAGNTPARHEDPSIDEVFPLVTDLGQLLLDWVCASRPLPVPS